MNGASRQDFAGVVAGVIAVLVSGTASVEAQSVSRTHTGSHFLRTKDHVFNLDQITHLDKGAINGNGPGMDVYFVGSERVQLSLDRDEAEALLSALGLKSPGHTDGGVGAGGSRLLLFDDFDGKPGLNWKPVRPDPSHASLAKNPGKLTITTQRGSIHGEETKDEFGEGIPAKNLYLIDNPLAKGADFVVTTCVSGFTPSTPYQQAGLIVYDDDDNYLKLGYEFDWHRGEGQTFYCVSEADAKPEHHPVEGSEQGLTRYWLRLAKRGDRFEYAASTDGKTFRVLGEVAWGDGAPKRVGVLAKNGGNKDAPEADAAFEFFELRAPSPPKGDAIPKD